MKILPEKKALLLRLRNPNRVLQVIPKSKRVIYEGKEYVAVPHQIEVVQVLKNLGITAPSPICYYYSWPGRYKPFDHQRTMAEFLTLHNRAYNLSDLGTGKTLATLWALDYLLLCKIVTRALVIAPLSTLERTWGDEIFSNFPHLDFVVLHGDRNKRLKLLEQDAHIYLINHDGIKVPGFVEALSCRPDINLIIVDELAQIGRRSGTLRFRALLKIVGRQHPRRVWGLTGAPIPNSPTDAWAQCRLLTPETVPTSFNRFRDMVMRRVSTFTWVPRDNALAVVKEAMQPAIRFHRDECIDLPPCMYETREVALTDKQKAAYREMLTKLYTEFNNGLITASNEGVKAQKLLQIACGAAYTSESEAVLIDATPRFQAVVDIIEQTENKVIVFVPFVGVIAPLKAFIEKHGYSVATVHGGTNKSERDETFSAFQRHEHPRVLLSIPQTMSHGLTLTAASVIVWYGPTTSADTYVQANARITRPGQKNNQLIVHIESTPLESRYFKRLKDRESLQGVLLSIIRDERLQK